MRILRMTGLALVAGFGLTAATALAAQKASPPASPASAAVADDEAASELRQYHRHRHHGGVANFIAMSLDTLGEDDAKRPQVEKLQSDLRAQMAPAREAQCSLLLTLADGVAAGAMDRVKVDAAIATLTTEAGAAREARLETLNQLHAILSPPERAALVDKVEAHWEVWRQVNYEEGAGRRERGGRLANLTKELSLGPDQVEKIEAALDPPLAGLRGKFDPKEVEAHVKALAKTFTSDSFDATSVTSNPNGHLASYGGARMASFYEAVTPLLTAEQRTKLAESLRERASRQTTTAGK